MMVRSEDIRDESRKLSNIVPNFERFFSPSQILGGGLSENCTRVITAAVDWKKFHEDTPTRSGVIVAHTLNFRRNFNFSRLNFFGEGDPRPSCGVRLVAWVNV